MDRFDEDAKRVLALAQTEAVRLHHGYIGTEHLILGLVREGRGVAAQALVAAGVDLRRLRETVENAVGRGDPQLEHTEIVLSPETRKVIAVAPEEADRLGAARIAPAHLLLGIVREPGAAGPILQGLGVSLEAIREQVMQTPRGD